MSIIKIAMMKKAKIIAKKTSPTYFCECFFVKVIFCIEAGYAKHEGD